MKKLLILFSFGLMCAVNLHCKKSESMPRCASTPPQQEEPQILEYASKNGLTVVKHSSGLYYQILSPGTGKTPALNSVVSISYVGKLTNNTVFDQQMDPSKTKWQLNTLIEGWQIGLPLIREGGSIILLVPSAMAY